MAEAAITELGDKLVGLTLKEAVDLADYLKDEYNIEPAAGGAVMVAGPVEEEAEEQTEFDVILTAPGDQKIKVIKAVREVTSLGLKEAKDLVDSAPKAIKEGLPKDEADKLVELIKGAGGAVELK